MLKKTTIMLLLIFILTSSIYSGSQKAIVGSWSGKLSVSGIQITLVFNISDSLGNLTATMDSPDQGAYGIPVDSVILSNDSVRIVSMALRGIYVGQIIQEGTKLKGDWMQNNLTFPLELEKGEVKKLNRPQEPKEPYPYDVEEIKYENTIGQATIAGTLTKPRTSEKFPAVLLISGSGAQDRDCLIFGHRSFKLIADYLTRRGIAVLRVDDRGVAESTGDMASATTEDLAGDAIAGVEYLRSRPDVNPDKVGLIGHSEGGIIAPMIASQTDDVAFIVLLAGTGLRGDIILNQQVETLSIEAGESETTTAASQDLQKRMFAVILNELDKEKAESKLRTTIDEWRASLDGEVKAALDTLNESFWELQIKQILTPWINYFISYDPIPALKKVKCPTLALNGSKDVQVLADENLSAIEKALHEGGNTNYTIKKLENLNHLFQNCETGLPDEYGEIEETFSPDALKIIGDWITEVIK